MAIQKDRSHSVLGWIVWIGFSMLGSCSRFPCLAEIGDYELCFMLRYQLMAIAAISVLGYAMVSPILIIPIVRNASPSATKLLIPEKSDKILLALLSGWPTYFDKSSTKKNGSYIK